MSDGPAAGSRRRVLITGASGFIGGHLVRELRDVGAVGASRSSAPASATAGTISYDPRDEGSMTRVLEGVQAVVHAAGRAHILRERMNSADSLRAFREGSVDTTRIAVRAAVAAGVRRFILLSSVSVYGESGPESQWTESTPLTPTTPYGVSRKEAEEVLRTEAGSGLEIVILRLPMVYGPGMKGNPLRLFDLIRSGRPIPLGAIRNSRSTLYVGNVVFAVRRLLDASTRIDAPGTFLVADAGTVSTPAFVREIAQALGQPARLWSVPLPLLRLIATMGSTLLGERFPLTPGALARLAGSLVVDASPLARAVGAPPFSREAGLRATAEWYMRSRGP